MILVITNRNSAAAQRRPRPEPGDREIGGTGLQYPIAGSESDLLDNTASDDPAMAHVAVLDRAGEESVPSRKSGDDLAPGYEPLGKRVHSIR